MSRETWNLIKQSKRFYIVTYRLVGTVVFLAVIFNLSMGFAIYYTYFNRPEHAFYATNGITPPVLLTPMDSPNYTSVPLLGNETDGEEKNKAIPE